MLRIAALVPPYGAEGAAYGALNSEWSTTLKERMTHPVRSVGSHRSGENDGAFGALLDPRLGYSCSAMVGAKDLGDHSVSRYFLCFSRHKLALSSKI